MLILAAIQKMIIDYYSALNNDQVTMSMILVAEIRPFYENKIHFIVVFNYNFEANLFRDIFHKFGFVYIYTIQRQMANYVILN